MSDNPDLPKTSAESKTVTPPLSGNGNFERDSHLSPAVAARRLEQIVAIRSAAGTLTDELAVAASSASFALNQIAYERKHGRRPLPHAMDQLKRALTQLESHSQTEGATNG